MTPTLQQRHFDYVLGPNQDSRLASVAAGQTITGIALQLDADAPFVLRSRAMRQSYSAALTQNGLQFLRTRWAGPTVDYRSQDFLLASLEMANFGQVGNPKPISPEVTYPANGILTVDIQNTGASAITNLTMVWRGVKLFPAGVVPAYEYPARFAGLSFCYPISIAALGVSEIRNNQLFTVKQDADFVIRGAQATAPRQSEGPRSLGELFFRLLDHNKKPYSNDYVPFDIFFGAGSWPATIPMGVTPSFRSPFGTGPFQPGLVYPEIYIPANHQFWYDVKRSDGAVGTNQNEDVYINLIGQKVFPR